MKLIALVVSIIIVLIVLLVFIIIEDNKQWDKFSAEHSCKVVSKVQGYTSIGTGVGVLSDGKVGIITTTNTTPGLTMYLCDDGVTYSRTTN